MLEALNPTLPIKSNRSWLSLARSSHPWFPTFDFFLVLQLSGLNGWNSATAQDCPEYLRCCTLHHRKGRDPATSPRTVTQDSTVETAATHATAETWNISQPVRALFLAIARDSCAPHRD
jgi:hypothetical protein